MARQTEEPFEEEKSKRVYRVMDQHTAYPDFGHLFDSVLTAAGFGNKEFACLYRQLSGLPLQRGMVGLYRQSAAMPPYAFVSALAKHRFFLPLDSERFREGTPQQRAGSYRRALFASAGLIEVTPEARRAWNCEVLAGYKQLIEHHPDAAKPTWQQVMRKLIAFLLQGERDTIEGIAGEARAQSRDPDLFLRSRLTNLLTDGNSIPTERERHALYRALALHPDQATFLETGIEKGQIPLRQTLKVTPFAGCLAGMLDRLTASGISSRRLVLMSRDPVSGHEGIRHTAIVGWRSNRNNPTMDSLRCLTRALRLCHAEGRRLISDEEIDTLVLVAGFTPSEINATCHDIIARITSDTRIQPLLHSIRNSADVCAPVSAVATMPQNAVPPMNLPVEGSLRMWEREKEARFPTAAQVRELLGRYNVILTEKGCIPMTPQEIDRVVTVAECDRGRRNSQPFTQRLPDAELARKRLPPSPSFDSGPQR